MMAFFTPGKVKSRLSCLVGEPEVQLLRRTVTTLGRRGMIVHQARHSSEVINIVRNRNIDFLMLDVDIPGMGGLNTYHQLKEMVRFVPCILMARELSAETRRRALDEQTFSIIHKPLQDNVLEEMVGRLVSRYFPAH